MSALPPCNPQNPLCGCCSVELDHDGEQLFCGGCKLFYPDYMGSEPAEFMDDDDEPCAAPCDNEWHAQDSPSLRNNKSLMYECVPCALPNGHMFEHWHGCRLVRKP